MSSLSVREPFVGEVLAQLIPLLQAHCAENELNRPPFNPDWPYILYMNGRGTYRALFLYHDEELIGYFSFFLLPSIHTSKLVATHDVLFVRKDWRTGRGALMLLREADRIMQDTGVTEVYAGHQGVAQLDGLMKHLGYRDVGKQYYKQFPGSF